MKIGTRSLMFGVHQFIWHPFTVYLAWKELYGKPNWKELICIIIHDWGYWGKQNLDGKEGIEHPKKGAYIAYKLFGDEYFELCAGHSRSYIRLVNDRFGYERWKLSKLCWADKLSIKYEPCWFYLLRAKLTGELKEYRSIGVTNGFASLDVTDEEWFEYGKNYLVKQALEQVK